jgi:hypothetical protein
VSTYPRQNNIARTNCQSTRRLLILFEIPRKAITQLKHLMELKEIITGKNGSPCLSNEKVQIK